MTKKNKKVYAVKTGRKTGIFNTWSECQKQVSGYSGAEFLGFKSRTEALVYLDKKKTETNKVTNNEIKIDEKRSILAYVDGSYDNLKKIYSCGVVVLMNGEKKELYDKGNDPNIVGMRNVAGEIMGAMLAMRYVIDNKLDEFNRLVIYHDYEGIAKWCTGEWKATKKGTKEYKDFYMKAEKLIKIDFVKVKAHSGDKYNEEADKLAKKALHLEDAIEDKIVEQEQEPKKEMITTKSKSLKPKIHIKSTNETIKTEEIIKRVKAIWRNKDSARKMRDINTLDIYINIIERKYEWEIQAKDGFEKGTIDFN